MRKLDNDMVLRADSPAIDLTTWLMFQSGSEFSAELLDLIARRVNDVVKAELKDEPPHLSFDEDNKDPTTMLLMLPLERTTEVRACSTARWRASSITQSTAMSPAIQTKSKTRRGSSWFTT